MTVRVIIADAQVLVRADLVALLTAWPGVTVVGEAGAIEQVPALSAETVPDVVLMDLGMSASDRFATTKQLLSTTQAHAPKVLALTTQELDRYACAALAAGVSGLLLKENSPERITSAVHTVAAGNVLLDPRIANRLAEAANPCRPPNLAAHIRLSTLTTRETEVLRMVATGLSNAEIAERLFLSETTVKTHVKRMMRKTQVSSRGQVIVVAYESGLVVPGETCDSRTVPWRSNGRQYCLAS